MRDMRKKEEGEKVKLGKKWIGGKDWRSERNAGVSPAGGVWVTALPVPLWETLF